MSGDTVKNPRFAAWGLVGLGLVSAVLVPPVGIVVGAAATAVSALAGQRGPLLTSLPVIAIAVVLTLLAGGPVESGLLDRYGS